MSASLFECMCSETPQYFQPMPLNFGIIPDLSQWVRTKRERYGVYRDRALADLTAWKAEPAVYRQMMAPTTV